MHGVERALDPEDVANEVVLRLLQSAALGRFEPCDERSFEAYLQRALDRTLIDLARGLNAVKRGEGRGELQVGDGEERTDRMLEVPSTATTPTGRARAEEIRELCLAVLAGREREVWSLCDVEGLDPADVAQRLGESSAAIRGVLFRARARLQPELLSRGWLHPLEDGRAGA